MGPSLHLRNLSKAYGATAAVADVSLTFSPGQFVTLLGPSGCGKSTTLRMIGGLETPTQGSISIGDTDITAVPPHRRPVNMVFQDYALFPHLSVRKNIAFGLELNGTPKSAIAVKVGELLEMMQLTEHADKRPHQLSGGQRQRVALARALAPDPQFLLLDEPLSALDAKLRQRMQEELKTLQRQTGKTFILVTHDQAEALSISDLVVVMNHGKVEQVGTPQDLYMEPKTEFVARFVGETNILTCDLLEATPDRVRMNWNGVELVARNPGNIAFTPGRRITAILRPESIKCSNNALEGIANQIEAEVRKRTFSGAQTQLELAAGEGSALLLASATSNEAVSLHDRIFIGWNEDNLVLIDTPGGRTVQDPAADGSQAGAWNE